MNMPQDFRTELARLNDAIWLTAVADATAWTVAVWCVARREWLAGSVAVSAAAVATAVGLCIFRKAQRTIEAADRALMR